MTINPTMIKMEMHEPDKCSNTEVPSNTETEPYIEISIHSPKNFNCIECDQDFSDYVQFQNHKKKTHVELVQCPICHTSFRRRDHYKRHMVTVHYVQKHSICPICNECKDYNTLSQHMSECHPEVTSYHCNECQYHAKDLQSLVSHKKHHFPGNKYVCVTCNTCFKRQDHLSRHIKSLHQKQLVSCEICKHFFKRKDHLLRHKREIHGVSQKRIYNKDL